VEFSCQASFETPHVLESSARCLPRCVESCLQLGRLLPILLQSLVPAFVDAAPKLALILHDVVNTSRARVRLGRDFEGFRFCNLILEAFCPHTKRLQGAKTALASRQIRMHSCVHGAKCTANWLCDAHCCAHYGPAVPVERPGNATSKALHQECSH
jgi:hypothetical protein